MSARDITPEAWAAYRAKVIADTTPEQVASVMTRESEFIEQLRAYWQDGAAPTWRNPEPVTRIEELDQRREQIEHYKAQGSSERRK